MSDRWPLCVEEVGALSRAGRFTTDDIVRDYMLDALQAERERTERLREWARRMAIIAPSSTQYLHRTVLKEGDL